MKKFTKEEEQYIISNYPNMETRLIAEKLNRTHASVHRKAWSLGVKKTAEFLEKDKERLRIVGASHRFQKGNVPLNKGQKMSTETYEKCSKTFFKKGGKPHNTKKENSIELRGDGYLWSKIKDKVWDLTHRLEWIKHNGQIPDGYIVVFKDKNRMNVSIENLELITLKENMLRNSIQNYPQEVQECMKLVSKIKKKINNYGTK